METEIKQVWELQTEHWLLVEYEKQPNLLAVSLNPNTDSEDENSFAFGFGSLGVDRDVLESADRDFIDRLFSAIAHYGVCNNCNVSVSSLWANLPYYLPRPNEWEDLEDEDRLFVEQAHNFISQNSNKSK